MQSRAEQSRAGPNDVRPKQQRKAAAELPSSLVVSCRSVPGGGLAKTAAQSKGKPPGVVKEGWTDQEVVRVEIIELTGFSCEALVG